MKKVLALVLAVVLAFGMTTVAFAAGKPGKATKITLGDYGTIDKTTFTKVGGSFDGNLGTLEANTTYYIEVTGEIYSTDTVSAPVDSGNIKKVSALSEYKIRTAIDDGGAYISSKPAFVAKNGKTYVTFKTADKFNKEPIDVSMDIRVFGGNSDYAPIYEDSKNEVSFSVAYQNETAVGTYTMMKGPLATFEGTEECEIEFKDSVVFAVNAKDQKDLFLRMSNSDDALTEKYPDADLKIVKFEGNNKTFRRTGVLTIPADMVENKDGKMVAPVIYNYEGGKLTVNKDAKYNEEKAAFEIKTNKLGNYVVANAALPASAPSTDEEEPVAPGTVPNPDTGANDFVGLAVALAVVSVAGIAVAKRK